MTFHHRPVPSSSSQQPFVLGNLPLPLQRGAQPRHVPHCPHRRSYGLAGFSSFKNANDENHHQLMTLVFGAIPPLAVVFALPFLLPSVPAEKVPIDDHMSDVWNV